MRWLITGSYGQLGTDLQAVLAATPEDVVRAVDLDVLDITDAAAVERAIASGLQHDVEQLRRVPRVVAVAAGPEKVEAIRGALATGVIHILVTDGATASGLVETERRRPRVARARKR